MNLNLKSVSYTHLDVYKRQGLEYSYSFRNGMQGFVMQKNDFVFWTRDHFRNGLLGGEMCIRDSI